MGASPYRLDIRRFFDSFDPAEVITRIEGLDLLSQRSKLLYRSLMSAYQAAGGKGIPTGLEISSVSAELMMSHFDTQLRMQQEVFFYGRFVDDMVIITRGDETQAAFLASLNNYLPRGLELSQDPKKRKVLSFQGAGAGPAQTASFEYLGYSFTVIDPKEENNGYSRAPRTVTIDYSEKTHNRTKTRIVRAFLSFEKDGNFNLLEKRIAYLTSNCRMNDSKTNVSKLVGVYHNHPHLSFHGTCGLVKLDDFLGAMLRDPGRTSYHPVVVLSPQQKARLLRHSFARGFQDRRYNHFSRPELSEIARCWKYAK